jgi:hypothetical protein
MGTGSRFGEGQYVNVDLETLEFNAVGGTASVTGFGDFVRVCFSLAAVSSGTGLAGVIVFITSLASGRFPTTVASGTIEFSWLQVKVGALINDPPILQTSGLAATRTAVAQSVGGLVLPPAIEARSRFRILAEPGAGTFRRVFSINNGTTSNAADVYINGTSNIRLFARSAATTVVDGGPASQLQIGRYYELVARYKANDFQLLLDDALIFSVASGAMPIGLNRVQFGNNAENLAAGTLNGEIANFSLREAA